MTVSDPQRHLWSDSLVGASVASSGSPIPSAGRGGVDDDDVPDDPILEAICTRRLDHARFPRVYLDATYVKARDGDTVRYEAIVVATGVRPDGGVEILGITVGNSEDPMFWVKFLTTLRHRGLSGMRTLGSDEHGGLVNALDLVFPDTRWELSPGTVPAPPPDAAAESTNPRYVSPRRYGWWDPLPVDPSMLVRDETPVEEPPDDERYGNDSANSSVDDR